MADYPGSITSLFSNKTDGVDTVSATDVNSMKDEIIAIETELGADVAGAETSLVIRLAQALLEANQANTETLAATKTLTDTDAPIQYLDPGGAGRDVNLPAEAANNHAFTIINTADAAETLTVKDDTPSTVLAIAQNQAGLYISDGTTWKGYLLTATAGGGGISNIVEDTTPQLGGDLDLNGNNLDFPTTPNISDTLDEDNMASNSATALATQQSIKAYADTKNPLLPLSAKGDLLVNDGTSDAKFAVGTNSQKLIADSGTTSGLSWIDDDFGFSVNVGDRSTVLSTDIQPVAVEVPFACTIEAARVFGDTDGSIVWDIWKNTYANYPPASSDSITASAQPTITSTDKSEDTTLTGWTTALSKGDVLFFNINSVTSFKWSMLSITGKKAATG